MSSVVLETPTDPVGQQAATNDPPAAPNNPSAAKNNPPAGATGQDGKKRSLWEILFKGNLVFQINIPKWTIWAIIALLIVILGLSLKIGLDNFENKSYDPFGTGIRFLQRRDDTGSMPTSLEERKYGSPQMNDQVSQLTSTPEAPNFSEYYGIDASLKNGSVMIERENFENSALSLDELEKANKGF